MQPRTTSANSTYTGIFHEAAAKTNVDLKAVMVSAVVDPVIPRCNPSTSIARPRK